MPLPPPEVHELTVVPDPFAALQALRGGAHPLLMESRIQREGVGRYSFLMADPLQTWTIPRVTYGTTPWGPAEQWTSDYAAETIPDLPPFQGGVAGLLSYSAGRAWERWPLPRWDEFQIPDVVLGLYDWVIAWDHLTHRVWIIAHGNPERELAARKRLAPNRIAEVIARLQSAPCPTVPLAHQSRLSDSQLAPQFVVPDTPQVTSTFTREAYLEVVSRGIKYIYAGDIFQVNLAQRLLAPLTTSPLTIYERLRTRNPAPFAAYFETPDFVLASASPERFLAVTNGEVETRPIKGTRRRQIFPEADLFVKDELRESAKDQAENVMIVDLLRNDLSRVCLPGSVRVPHLCTVETYETVQHLVSEIRGQLRPETSIWDLLAASFPGGSITGAPKVRAMEIIAELEPTVRGPYCGSLFYLGFDRRCDSSILIRTFTIARGWLQCCVGGGIVALSDPAAEYSETLHKAAGMLRALSE